MMSQSASMVAVPSPLDERETETSAPLLEIFASRQGEGIYAGEPHVFLRFDYCNLHCVWCDELDKPKRGLMTTAQILEELDGLRDRAETLSLTGGEPLLYPELLKHMLPQLKARGWRIYLETNGTLPHALQQVIRWVDVVAMDIKLPSSTKEPAFWTEHKAFLAIARSADLFVKVVVTPDTVTDEVVQAAQLVAGVDSRMPFIIQPVTPYGPVRQTPRPEQLDRWCQLLSRWLEDVRIVPQLHKEWGIP